VKASKIKLKQLSTKDVGSDMKLALGPETLVTTPQFCLQRSGRFITCELLAPHRVLSTSVRNGGQTEHLRYLINHQSCEGADHRERERLMMGMGLDAYHDAVCRELTVNPDEAAMLGTAANMNYAAVAQASDNYVTVIAIVTAGVQGNACCAGDPAAWRETADGWENVSPVAGTINTLLLINHPLTEGALARSVVTMTEAKSAALQRLVVRSRYSQDFATGTGTDQYCVAAPLSGNFVLNNTSPHTKLGELIGVVVRDATLEALRWQNGLDSSGTRLLFHALGRFGVVEATFVDDLAPLLSQRELELLQKNLKSVVYEPKVAAAAYAMAAILDRIRHGVLPATAARDVFRQYAAVLATSLAAKPDHWPDFFSRLSDVTPERPADAVFQAIAMGWSEKWR
jgi:adenosylcobinamide amidohydrolase